MMTLEISGEEYKVKFGYNSFADSNLLERVQDIAVMLDGAENDADVSGMGKIRELFCIVRELLFVGFKKFNPVESVQDVGDLLDTYMEETPEVAEGEEPENRGVLALFLMLSAELTNEGFFKNFMETINSVESENVKKIPQDHKKKVTKKK